jgi:hypothetical protein
MNPESRSLSRREVLKTCAALAVGAGLSPASIGATESTAIGGHLHHILRIHLPLDMAEQRTGEVIDYCRRTGCQEVLLFTTSYDHAPSFQSLEEIGKYMQAILPQVERLRQAGVIISGNVLQTLGHVYFPMALQKQFPFQRRVFADGHVSTEGACPLCPNLRAWVSGAYKIYAGLRPPVLFVDDDYRTMMAGGMSCFCPLHLKRIGELAGRAVTREEVVGAVLGDAWPAPELRRHYYTATTAGFVGLAEEIRRAVDSVSPETRVGLMTANWPTGVQGVDVPQVLKALAGPHRPMVRPQIPGYSEAFIRDAAPAFLNPIRMRAALPDNVEYWPEIENYQYSLYAKSARCTLAQMAVCVLNGFNHLALNVFDMFGSPLGDSKLLIELLESNRGFLDRVHTLVPEGSRPRGINVFEHPKQLLVRRAAGSLGRLLNSDAVSRRLPVLGLPVTAGTPSPWQMLTGDDVLALDDAALDTLLARGALMDTTAAQALALRGRAGRIGVTVGDAIPLDELGYEQFSDTTMSPLLRGRCFPLRPLVQGGDWRRLAATTAARTASEIRNYRRDVVGPALLLTENTKGERFGVLAFSGGGDRHLMENLMRPEQLRNTLAWIARRPLPVCAHYDAPYLWPILNHAADGRLVIGLINLATDAYDTLPLIFDRQFVPRRLSVVQPNGRMVAASFSMGVSAEDQATRLNVRHRLEPFGVAVLVAG